MSTHKTIQTALKLAVDEGVFPGAQLAVRLRGELQCVLVAGRLSSEPIGLPVQVSSMYDLGSLTKPLATGTSMLLLVQRATVGLDDPVQQVLGELEGWPIGQTTVRDLLTHRSGLPAWRPFYREIPMHSISLELCAGASSVKHDILNMIRNEPLSYVRGERSVYSDLGFMLLGFLVERLSGMALDQWYEKAITQPLKADSLVFCPTRGGLRSSIDRGGIASTEQDRWRNRLLCGEVHDENAGAMGGVAGHAGLFGSVESVLAISGAWLRAYHGQESIFDEELVRQFTARQGFAGSSSWALGWDTPSVPSSSGVYFSDRSFGHLGFTGTSVWIDPVCELEVVLLSNRVHPNRKNEQIRAFRPYIHDLIYQEVMAKK